MARKRKPTTNITEDHKNWLDYIQHSTPSDRTIALFSCFVNGEPTAAICVVSYDGTNYNIMPLFVAVTPGMDLRDHDNTATEGLS
jgi:hypothetical protein